MAKKVKTLRKLAELAELKKAVIVPAFWIWNQPRPAAFILRLQGWEILKLLNAGMYVYEKKTGYDWSH